MPTTRESRRERRAFIKTSRLNVSGNQYPLQPSYYDINNAWAPTQEMNIYQDPDIPAPLSQYPVAPLYNYPPFQTYPTNQFEHQPYDNLVNGEFNDFDHDDDNNYDISGHGEMTDYLHGNDLDINPMLEQDLLGGLEKHKKKKKSIIHQKQPNRTIPRNQKPPPEPHPITGRMVHLRQAAEEPKPDSKNPKANRNKTSYWRTHLLKILPRLCK